MTAPQEIVRPGMSSEPWSAVLGDEKSAACCSAGGDLSGRAARSAQGPATEWRPLKPPLLSHFKLVFMKTDYSLFFSRLESPLLSHFKLVFLKADYSLFHSKTTRVADFRPF